MSAFVEGPIDFFKSQIQVQIIRSRSDPNYKRRLLVPALHTQQGLVLYERDAVYDYLRSEASKHLKHTF